MKVAIFPMLPRASAATRAVCVRPLPYLAQRGIEARVYEPAPSGAFDALLAPGPLRPLRAALLWYGLVLPRRLGQLARARSADVVLVQRSMFRIGSPPLLERLARRALRKPLVLHCDDALHAVAPGYRARLAAASCVVTGSDEVERAARAAAVPVRRLEGSIDVARYPLRRHESRDPVVVGWVGYGPQHFLPAFAPALARVPGVEYRIVGDSEYVPAGSRGSFERWRLDREYAAFSGLDVGIMPLEDTAYNRGKEAYKLKEYMAAGLPVVCSPVGHNATVVEHGVTGFHAASDDDWVEYLTMLARDHTLRARLGAAARRVAEERYDVRVGAAALGRILESVCAG